MAVPYKGIAYELSINSHFQLPDGNGRRMPCTDMELNMMECLEAYGLSKGRLMCQKYMEDYRECKMPRLRVMRANIMRQERLKKVINGEIPWQKPWGKPYNYDAYIQATFFP